MICSSWSRFNLLEMDFGAKIESFEGVALLDRKIANVGSIWMEHGGARLAFVMRKKRWKRGIWQELSKGDSLSNRNP